MKQTLLLITLACSLLGFPILCDAGLAEHDCLCSTEECCDTEALCEWDSCGEAFKTEEARRDEMADLLLQAAAIEEDTDPQTHPAACFDTSSPLARSAAFPGHVPPLRR